MSYDSPVELESALNPCDSHGSLRGGGAACPPPYTDLNPQNEGEVIQPGFHIMWTNT